MNAGGGGRVGRDEVVVMRWCLRAEGEMLRVCGVTTIGVCGRLTAPIAMPSSRRTHAVVRVCGVIGVCGRLTAPIATPSSRRTPV